MNMRMNVIVEDEKEEREKNTYKNCGFHGHYKRDIDKGTTGCII